MTKIKQKSDGHHGLHINSGVLSGGKVALSPPPPKID